MIGSQDDEDCNCWRKKEPRLVMFNTSASGRSLEKAFDNEVFADGVCDDPSSSSSSSPLTSCVYSSWSSRTGKRGKEQFYDEVDAHVCNYLQQKYALQSIIVPSQTTSTGIQLPEHNVLLFTCHRTRSNQHPSSQIKTTQNPLVVFIPGAGESRLTLIAPHLCTVSLMASTIEPVILV